MTKHEETGTPGGVRPSAERETLRSDRTKPRERILYISHVDWGWIKQRPHQIAEHLRRFFDVTVVFNCNWRRKGLPNKFEFSRSCLPLFHLPLRGRIPLLAKLDVLAIRLMLRIAIWFVRPRYAWLTWPDLFQYLPRETGVSIIYDCMDDAQAFPRDAHRIAQIAELESAVVARAEIVFVSSNRLRHILEARHGQLQKYHLLRNAFDGKIVSDAGESARSDGAFKIGYCGTIAQWCDWELLTKLVEARPGVEVHLVGPLDAGASLQVHSQIVWHGPVEHGDLPEIMGAFDCLIMPFKVTPLIESVDPVKLYEYVNFGKPIVSVFYDEIERFAPFVHFYRSHDEALAIVAKLASGEIGRKYSNDERRASLLVNTWAERASVAAALLMASRAYLNQPESEK